MSALYYYFYKRTALSIADPRYIQHMSFQNFHFLDFLWLKLGLLEQICFKSFFYVAFMKSINNHSTLGFTRTWAGWSRRVLPDRSSNIWSQFYQYSGTFQAFQVQPKLSLLEILCVWHCSHNVPNVIWYRHLMLHLLIDWEKMFDTWTTIWGL